jgi:teichuronic acid biosynthesis glycosyltransferase TuaC
VKILVLSGAFPSATRPTYAVFVGERVRYVARHADVLVVAPVPWAPFNRLVRGEAIAATPAIEVHHGVPVEHPRFACTPLVGKTLDAAFYALSMVPVVARLRRRFPFDVIDAHFTYPDGVAAVLLGKMFRVPTFVTIRGTHDIRNASSRLRRAQIRWALRNAAGVIAVSDSLRQFAEGLGIEPSHIRVIPNGIDTDRFTPGDMAEARARLGLPADRTILLSVGALTEGKGHHRVVEALPELVARRPDLLYLIVGGDPTNRAGRPDLEALVRRAGMHAHVKVVGARPHDELPGWLAAADLFCLSTRSEGWCNALTESLACGLPVVTTAVGGNPEVVRDGEDGFLVPFWDRGAFVAAVLRALDRRWDRSSIAARAGTRGWERTADDVMETLRAALTVKPTVVAPEGARKS